MRWICLIVWQVFWDLLYSRKEQSLDEEIEALIAQRTRARAEKDWATADRIRDELKARHVVWRYPSRY